MLRTSVVSVERLGPSWVRIVVSGEDLRGFGVGEFTDHYVKLQLGKVRTYTVRAFDPERLELTIDFFVHGDSGVAGPWALAAKPGDPLELKGPGGGYAPDPSADWHLLVGDEAVFPAIAVSLSRIPAGVPAFVVCQAAGTEDEVRLATVADLRLRWVHRPASLLDAVAALELPAGRGHAFVHGEATAVREIRRHLVVDRGMSPDQLSASGYWKQRLTDEQWREEKPEWKRQAEADLVS
jgi:NADPH-dependent ferric siderophore reductase